MRFLKTFAILSFIFAGIAAGQGRLFDRVTVDFPNQVNVAGTVLPPGRYEIRQLRNSASGSRVLFATRENGQRFEAEGATIPLLDNLTPTKTRVTVRRTGGVDYLNQIWIAGKNYGYEFPLPEEARSLAAGVTETITLAGTFSPETPQVAQNERPAPPPVRSEAPRADAQSQTARPAPSPAPAEQTPSPAAAAPPPPQPTQLAQATPATPPAAPAPQARPEPAKQLPATASQWPAALILGIFMLCAALALRRWRTGHSG